MDDLAGFGPLATFELQQLRQCFERIMPIVTEAQACAARLAEAGEVLAAQHALADIVGVLRAAADLAEARAAVLRFREPEESSPILFFDLN